MKLKRSIGDPNRPNNGYSAWTCLAEFGGWV